MCYINCASTWQLYIFDYIKDTQLSIDIDSSFQFMYLTTPERKAWHYEIIARINIFFLVL